MARPVAEYLAGALWGGGVAIVIATEAHRRAFERELSAVGVDLAALDEQRVVWLDAAEVLARFMSAGVIDADAFHREVGSAITSAAATGRPVWVYGEMVQLLWDAGQVVAVLELESLWNGVIAEHGCSLMCAYRRSSVSGAQDAEALRQVCELHSAVLHAPASEAVQTYGPSLGAEVVARFLPELVAPREARRVVTDALRRSGHTAALIEDARLVVSELASNAVVHARSAFSVAVQCSDRGARIAIRDASPDRPMIRDPQSDATHGRGLRLVAALATEWGVEITTTGKTVWAELTGRIPPAPERGAATFSSRSPVDAPARGGSRRLGGRERRAALYRHVADTLERSADLAERHAAHEQRNGRRRSAAIERDRAKRARKAARRARALASRVG